MFFSLNNVTMYTVVLDPPLLDKTRDVAKRSHKGALVVMNLDIMKAMSYKGMTALRLYMIGA